jgi:hypothetical protein
MRRKIWECVWVAAASWVIGLLGIYNAWMSWCYEEPSGTYYCRNKDVVSMPGASKLGMQLKDAPKEWHSFIGQDAQRPQVGRR